MSERKIKNLLRIEMNRRMAFLRAKELRDRAEEECAKTFKALQRAKRYLFLAGFKGNIMRDVKTLSDLLGVEGRET